MPARPGPPEPTPDELARRQAQLQDAVERARHAPATRYQYDTAGSTTLAERAIVHLDDLARRVNEALAPTYERWDKLAKQVETQHQSMIQRAIDHELRRQAYWHPPSWLYEAVYPKPWDRTVGEQQETEPEPIVPTLPQETPADLVSPARASRAILSHVSLNKLKARFHELYKLNLDEQVAGRRIPTAQQMADSYGVDRALIYRRLREPDINVRSWPEFIGLCL